MADSKGEQIPIADKQGWKEGLANKVTSLLGVDSLPSIPEVSYYPSISVDDPKPSGVITESLVKEIVSPEKRLLRQLESGSTWGLPDKESDGARFIIDSEVPMILGSRVLHAAIFKAWDVREGGYTLLLR